VSVLQVLLEEEVDLSVIHANDATPIQHLPLASARMHVGFIVPDLDLAMDQYGRLYGWKWTRTVRVHHELKGPCASEEELYVAFATGSPMIELIEDRPGSIWSAGASPLHHLGCWVTDLEEAGDILTREGFEFCGRGRRVGTSRFAYAIYRNCDGLLLEIQDARFERGWRSLVAAAR